MTADYTNTVT